MHKGTYLPKSLRSLAAHHAPPLLQPHTHPAHPHNIECPQGHQPHQHLHIARQPRLLRQCRFNIPPRPPHSHTHTKSQSQTSHRRCLRTCTSPGSPASSASAAPPSASPARPSPASSSPSPPPPAAAPLPALALPRLPFTMSATMVLVRGTRPWQCRYTAATVLLSVSDTHFGCGS
jgi:hypothetical protein